MLASLACSFVLAEYNKCESFQDLVLPDRRKGVDKINVHRRLLTVFIFPVANHNYCSVHISSFTMLIVAGCPFFRNNLQCENGYKVDPRTRCPLGE